MESESKRGKLLKDQSGISVIEILVSVAVLSLVTLYVFQSFLAASNNIVEVERVDYAKMIAETLSAEIMSDPDTFMSNVIWYKANPTTESIPADLKHRFFKKNASLTYNKIQNPSSNDVVHEGTLTAYYTAKGNLIHAEADKKLEVSIKFKQKIKEEAIKLNAAQMTGHNTKLYNLDSNYKRYLLVITDDEEAKLKSGGTEISTSGISKLHTHVYKNFTYEQLIDGADEELSFLNEGTSPWLRTYSWVQLIDSPQQELNLFMKKIISIPPDKVSDVKTEAQRIGSNFKFDSGEILSSQMDKEFGATPILVAFDKYGVNEAFELEVANLSSLHADVLLKRNSKDAKITTEAVEGSVNFIDLSKTEYNNLGIEVDIEVKDSRTSKVLYRLGERDERYKIEPKTN